MFYALCTQHKRLWSIRNILISHCYLFFCKLSAVIFLVSSPWLQRVFGSLKILMSIFLSPFVTWELVSQSASTDYYASDVHYRDTLSLRLYSSCFFPLSLTPFFLCQFPFNWTFCHQTRFITCSAVEGNGAEIRICSVRDTGPSTEGCDLAGRLPPWGASRFPPLKSVDVGGAGKGKEE